MPQIRTDRRKVSILIDALQSFPKAATSLSCSVKRQGLVDKQNSTVRSQVLPKQQRLLACKDEALQKSDCIQDRVEASPEQLARASALADRLTEESQQTTRVIGW